MNLSTAERQIGLNVRYRSHFHDDYDLEEPWVDNTRFVSCDLCVSLAATKTCKTAAWIFSVGHDPLLCKVH